MELNEEYRKRLEELRAMSDEEIYQFFSDALSNNRFYDVITTLHANPIAIHRSMTNEQQEKHIRYMNTYYSRRGMEAVSCI